jgi:predicted phage-related endonuclease
MSVVKYIDIDRHKGLGGSDSHALMQTNVAPIHELWELKTQRKPGPDLSNVLPVQIGTLTEEFNLKWFTKQTGIYTETYPMEFIMEEFRMAHFDGWCPTERAIIECKHTNHYNKLEHVKVRYYAQIQHYLMLAQLDVCYLSVLFGNARWEYCAIPSHKEYQDILYNRQEKFWDMVVKDKEPTAANTAWRLYE